MTMNIAATVWNLLVWAFFVVVVLGVGIGTYAAVSLKRAEIEHKD